MRKDTDRSNYNLTFRSYEDNAKLFAQKWLHGNDDDTRISRFVEFLGDPPKRIIDLGCGFGRDLKWFSSAGYSCIGVDSCSQFVEIAHDLCETNCTIICDDMLSVEFPFNSVNGVWSRGTLFHLTRNDFVRILKKCYRWLRDDGILSIQLIAGEGCGIYSIDNDSPKAFYQLYNEEEVIELMLENGYVLLYKQDVPKRIVHIYSKKHRCVLNENKD